jgi:hypothetical protein
MKDKLSWNEEGDLQGVSVYPRKVVEIKVNGEPVEIGYQPEYEVLNIINKDKVDKLKIYLQEQLDMLLARKKQAVEVIAKTEAYSLEGMKEAIEKLPKDKMNAKKLQELNGLSKNVLMNTDAKANLIILDNGIAEIEEQLDFIK